MSDTATTTQDVIELHTSDIVPSIPAVNTAPQAADKALRRPLVGLGGQILLLLANKDILPEELAQTAGIPVEIMADIGMGKCFDLTIGQFCKIASALGCVAAIQLQVPKPE